MTCLWANCGVEEGLGRGSEHSFRSKQRFCRTVQPTAISVDVIFGDCLM